MWGDVISLKNEAISGLDSKGLDLRVLLQGLQVFFPSIHQVLPKMHQIIKVKICSIQFSLVYVCCIVRIIYSK